MPAFTPSSPLRLLVSACLTGVGCGVDGSTYGAPFPHLARILDRPDVRVIAFCPEDLVFGTPRRTPDIHGGTGADVLDGRARVVSDAGDDWTEPMLRAADTMVAVAGHNRVHLALLTDVSAACGSQVIYRGARSQGVHQAGMGVCAALLVRHGVKVGSQRDHRTFAALLHKLDPGAEPSPGARDHHESPWFVAHLGAGVRARDGGR